MKQDKNERNKTALFYLFFTLIFASIFSFSGWTFPSKYHASEYYETAVNPFLGGVFLFLAFLVIIIPYVRKKIKKGKNVELV